MQPKLNPDPKSLPGSDSKNVSDEQTSIRQLMANGKIKVALDRAKDFHKAHPSASSESLLIEAYAVRVQSLLDKNLVLEAKSLQQLVRERFPASIANMDALNAANAARGNDLNTLLKPLVDADLSAELRATIEQTLQNSVVDLKALANCTALPADHPLRTAAAALNQAFQLVTSGTVTDEQISLSEISHRSPLAPWKLLVRAIACFHRNQDAACLECLNLIKPGSAPGRLVPAMQAMVGQPPAAPLNPAETTLLSRTAFSNDTLRRELLKLDEAFENASGSEKALKQVRVAMQECRKIAPGQVENLKRLIAIRCAVDDVSADRVAACLNGLPKADASYYRSIACGLSTSGDPRSVAAACEFWDQFRMYAVREGWFPANGVEEATLYLHMAKLLLKLDVDELDKLFFNRRFHGNPSPEEYYFLLPEELFKRACALDPQPQSYAPWLAYTSKIAADWGEEIAKDWHKVRPMDIEPMLHLVNVYGERDAFPTALNYLDKVEEIDPLHSAVRGARFQLLAAAAIRHVEKRKLKLAVDKLALIKALPQAKQGDRPAFLTAMDYLIASIGYNSAAKDIAFQELKRLVGTDVAADLLIGGLAAASKHYSMVPETKWFKLSKEERFALPASVALVAGIAEDLNVTQFRHPFDCIRQTEKHFAKSQDSLNTNQLRLLTLSAFGCAYPEFAYVVSGAGLGREGPTQARFLMLRAKSIPEYFADRREVCATAAAAFARASRDQDLIDEAVEFNSDEFSLEPFVLTLEQAQVVVKKERSAKVFPARGTRTGPDYDDLLPAMNTCNCPDCRRKRGEFAGRGLDLEGDLDIDHLRELFDSNKPEGIPKELADSLFETLQQAIMTGVNPQDIFQQTFGNTPSGKKKKGKRK